MNKKCIFKRNCWNKNNLRNHSCILLLDVGKNGLERLVSNFTACTWLFPCCFFLAFQQIEN